MVSDYFGELFSSNGQIDNEVSLSFFQETKVIEQMNKNLDVPYSEGELMIALNQMHPTKAPGVDGIPALFYQKYWTIIRQEVVAVCTF